MKPGMIQATDGFERIVHWALAISCIVLFITGLSMMFQSLNILADPIGGVRIAKFIHNWVGIFFIAPLFFAISMWWKEAGTFKLPADLEWMKCAGGYLWHVDNPPKVGKYNPGQKMFFLAVAGCGSLMVVTGILMWLQFLPMALTRWMYAFHALGFVTLFAFFFVHLYLGTIGNPGSLQAMTHGWVTKEWAKKQHPLWLEEMEHEGKLVVFGEEKGASTDGH